MLNKLTVILLLFVNAQIANAQGYADNWVVSNGFGLNFNTGSPIYFNAQVHNSIIGVSQIASISDRNGNLLFYVAEDSVINRNHQLIANGDGLKYHKFSNWGYPMIIIPKPETDSIFYVVHMSENFGIGGYPGTIFYTVVNIKANNGNGVVLNKNVPIDSNGVNPSSLAPVYNDLKKRYEVFYTTQGTSPNPGTRQIIIDSTGIHWNLSNPQFLFFSNLRFNTKGDLAVESTHIHNTSVKKIRLFSFDKTTSLFSLEKSFILEDTYSLIDHMFSPSGRYLYVSITTDYASLYDPFQARIYRYDLFQPDTTAIKNSRVNIAIGNYPLACKSLYGRMQLAPNQKIYITISSLDEANCPFSLGVINHPDSLYSGNLSVNAVNVQGNKVYWLPNFVLNWIERPPFSLRHACQDSVLFDLTYKNIVDSVYWDFGDSASGAANHSNLLNPVHHYTSYGAYWVQVTTCWQGECDTLADSVHVEPVPVVKLPSDTLLCAGESLFVDVGQGFNANYLWNTGSSDSSAILDKSGQYIVTAYNNCGSHADTIYISVIEPPTAQLKDTVACDNFQIVLHVVADSATYLWSTGATEPTIYPTTSGTYTVDIENPCGFVQDQARVEYKKCICNVYVANAFTPNNDGTNDYFKPVADCPEFSYTLQIFDRWGSMLGEFDESRDGWDGTHNGQLSPTGVYTYRLVYTGREYERTINKELYGQVSLIR